MKPLFTQTQLENAKSEDKLPCECYQCSIVFYSFVKLIKHQQSGRYKTGNLKFCSQNCFNKARTTSIEISCSQCNKPIVREPYLIKKHKNHFCSRSCNAIFSNTHKTKGIRTSKLEQYLQVELPKLFPNLQFCFNDKLAINSELDIYLPELKLAFELNGIFHYEPIFGNEKLQQIQNNDNRKFHACAERNISLCIIDASGLTYFKPAKADKYLQIIVNIINQNLI